MSTENRSTALHAFLHWERTQPDEIQFTQPYVDGSVVDYTWKEVGDQTRRVANYLRSLNLPARSSIVILGKNTAHWVMADLAIWMAGHVSVPLYTTVNSETARYVLEHCDARALFVGKLDAEADNWEGIKSVVPKGMPVIELPMAPPDSLPGGRHWEELVAAGEPLRDISMPTPADLATILYTSGSTGLPKGVMHSFGSTIAYSEGSCAFTGMNHRDRLLSYLPLAHTAERAFVETNSLYSGCRVYFSDSLATFMQDLARARPTLFISMPRLWTKFYAAINARLTPEQQALLTEESEVAGALKKQVLTMLGLDAVRLAFTGSAQLPIEIIDWYRHLGLELLEVYAMTEDFCYSHYSRPGEVRLGYCGTPMPGVERRIAEDGEILIRSRTQMMGYYRQPDLTAKSMTDDGYFRTGDRGEIDEVGRLKITGRVKEIFKTSKGKYISPAPIENHFNHPKVEAVCVTGANQAQPYALVMLTPEAAKELEGPATRSSLIKEMEALLEEVNAGLDKHEKLSHLVILKDRWSMENGSLTPTMKIRRSVIEARHAEQGGWVQSDEKVVVQA